MEIGISHHNSHEIATASSDVQLYKLTSGRKGYVRAITITNNAASTTKVSLWDAVSTSSGTAMYSYIVGSGTSIALDKNDLGDMEIYNGLVAQASVATSGGKVFVYVCVEETP